MTSPLYQEIAESIRQAIFYGELSPGDELPPVRDMSKQWDCAPGTVQRAYRELAQQGWIISRPGQGTRIAETAAPERSSALRRATLANEAESFLLRVLASGHTVTEVEQALRLALDRWRAIEQDTPDTSEQTLRFVGSHDPAIALIADRFGAQLANHALHITFAGSLGGLIALAERKADIAGCHLWDAESDTYNLPFVRRLLPGQRVALVTLAHRRLGFILPADATITPTSIAELSQPGVRFINRQPGAGTRVWLDAQLAQADIAPDSIAGYDDSVMTHTDVARAIAEGRANVGLGVETAAQTYGLRFHALASERYDLVIPVAVWTTDVVQRLVQWLTGPAARAMLDELTGYDTQATGQITWSE